MRGAAAARALVAAVLLLTAAVVAMDFAGGPFAATTGVVRALQGGTALVMLSDGSLVEASVPKTYIGSPGEAVDVRVLHHVLGSATHYEVLGPRGVTK